MLPSYTGGSNRGDMKGRWLIFIFISSLLLMGFSPPEVIPTKAKVPIDVEIYIDGIYQVGGELVITLTTRPLLPAPKIRIVIILPEGLELKAGETAWEGSMSKEEEKDLEISVRILKEGHMEVVGVASIEYPDGSRLVKSASGAIEVGKYKKSIPPGVKKRGRSGQEIIEFE